ncbi:MAG: hypothetical protein WBQ10_21825 [Terriglobales bacterium]
MGGIENDQLWCPSDQVFTAGEISRTTTFCWMFTTGAGVAVLVAAVLGLVVGFVVSMPRPVDRQTGN